MQKVRTWKAQNSPETETLSRKRVKCFDTESQDSYDFALALLCSITHAARFMDRELPPAFLVLPQPAQEFVKEALRLGMSPQAYNGNEAAALCEKAIEQGGSPEGRSLDLTRAVAGLHILKGQILEREPQNPRLADVLASYEAAISLLDIPEANDAMQREGAVAWMNVGNVLQRMGSEAEVHRAVDAYNVTVGRLRPLIDAEPLARSTLGAALLNRGTALQRLNTRESHASAAETYQEALQVLSVRPAGYEDHFMRLSIGAELNHGGAILAANGPDRAEEAITAAKRVMEAVAQFEERDLAAADMTLRARRLCCEALGILLQATAGQEDPRRAQWIADATDHAERALQLAQFWDHKGVFGFRPVVPWFLHFAATVYAHHQPQFLGEFLLDTLDAPTTPAAWKAAAQLKQIALQTIERLRAHLRSAVFQNLTGPDAERWNEMLADLGQAETRLTPKPAGPTTA